MIMTMIMIMMIISVTIQAKANEQYIAWSGPTKEPLVVAKLATLSSVAFKTFISFNLFIRYRIVTSRVLLNRPYWLEPIWSLFLLVSQASPKFFRQPHYKDVVHLWEFLLELLAQENCHSVISWVCKERSEFRIENPQELAKKWGAFKNKRSTNYENLSRSLRFYYNQGILKKVGWA